MSFGTPLYSPQSGIGRGGRVRGRVGREDRCGVTRSWGIGTGTDPDMGFFNGGESIGPSRSGVKGRGRETDGDGRTLDWSRGQGSSDVQDRVGVWGSQ